MSIKCGEFPHTPSHAQLLPLSIACTTAMHLFQVMNLHWHIIRTQSWEVFLVSILQVRTQDSKRGGELSRVMWQISDRRRWELVLFPQSNVLPLRKMPSLSFNSSHVPRFIDYIYRCSWDAKTDMRISIETGKHMPLGLGTAEKNSGSVMQRCMFVSQMLLLPSLSFVLTHSNPWERERWVRRKQ